ncbi:MAG: sigma-54 dependent transcriptional regulator [Desulfobacteraceae bacterium]|nr:sigma-54 dependent transcriptional regulator [Desulfobacteraceae bacterium]
MNVNDAHILIVDDDKKYALELKNSLTEIGEVDVVHSEEEFNTVFAPYKYDLIFLDLRLREAKEGLDLLENIIGEDPLSVVIIISGYGDIATAVEALDKGAKTFLEKSKVSPQEICIRAEHALKESVQERRIRQLERSSEIDEFVGDDTKIQKIKELINGVAQDGETTVLIRGETGTGKELVAKAIHRLGVRSQWPFVTTALVEKNIETIVSELFGHEKGAFTGAVDRHYGCFEEAHKGILFLDEIGDLPVDIQAKLLRVIEEKKIRRMGGNKDINVDVQVVTATNRPLEEMKDDGRFREDLYYRLNVFPIHLPPLRERRKDIPLLAKYFLSHLRKKGKTQIKNFTDNAVELILNYRWPGNVRQLQSVVTSAVLVCGLEGSQKIAKRHIEPLLLPHYALHGSDSQSVFKTLAETELRMAENALIRSGGKKTEAWKLLKYKNRFSMLRRVKRIMSEHPDLAEQFPELKKSYS